jgi:hypothetical protein
MHDNYEVIGATRDGGLPFFGTAGVDHVTTAAAPPRCSHGTGSRLAHSARSGCGFIISTDPVMG